MPFGRKIRWRRLTKRLARWIAIFVIAVVGLFVGLVSSLNLPAVQALIVEKVNTALDDAFVGKVRVRHLGHLGLNGVSGVDFAVTHANGRQVLDVRGAAVTLSVLDLLRSGLASQGPLVVAIDDLTISHADLSLARDGSGGLLLTRAFEPEPKPETGPARPIEVSLKRFSVTHAWVHGQDPPVDADLSELSGSLALVPGRTQFVLDAVRLRLRNVPLFDTASGELFGKMTIRTDTRARDADAPPNVDADAHLDATLGAIKASANFELHGRDFTASVVVPRTEAEVIRRTFPAATIGAPLSVKANARGTLDHFDLGIESKLGQARVHLAARVSLEPTPRVKGRLTTRKLDLENLSDDAPTTNLDALATFDVRWKESGPSGSVLLRSKPFSLGTLRIPAAVLDGHLTPTRYSGRLTLAEPGAPTEVVFEIVPRDGARLAPDNALVTLDLTSQLEDPKKIQLVDIPAVQGSGTITARAKFDAHSRRADAKLHARLRNLRWEAFSSKTLEAHVALSGPLRDPRIAADVALEAVTLGERRLSALSANVSGNLRRLRVDARGSTGDKRVVELGAYVRQHPSLSIEDVVLETRMLDKHATLRAKAVSVSPEGFQVDELQLEGAGRATVDLKHHDGNLRLQGHGQEVDPGELAELAGVPFDWLGDARLTFDVDLTLSRDNINGQGQILIADLTREKIDAELRFAAHDNVLNLEARGHFGTRGFAYARAKDLRLPPEALAARPAPSLASLARTHGRLYVASTLDLGWLSGLLRRHVRSAPELNGFVATTLDWSRPSDESAATWSLRVATHELGVLDIGRQNRLDPVNRTEAQRRWSLGDVDVELTLSKQTGGKLALRGDVLAGNRVFAEVEAETLAPALVPLENLLHRLSRQESKLEVRLPERRISSYPPLLRTSSLDGRVTAHLRARGTALEPELTLKLTVEDLKAQHSKRGSLGTLTGHLTHARRTTEIEATLRSGERRILDLKGEVRGELQRPDSWRSDGTLELDHFPVSLLGLASALPLAGRAHGSVRFNDLGGNPRGEFDVRFSRLRFAEGRFPSVALSGAFDSHHAELELSAVRARGTLRARARIPLKWHGLAPALQRGPGTLDLHAKNFELESFQPLVSEYLTQLRGKLDASLHVDLENPARTRGALSIQHGVVQVPALGQDLRDIQARAQLEPHGRLRLARLEGRGYVGRFSATGTADLRDGALTSSEGTLIIPKGSPMSATVEGVAFGQVSGEARWAYAAAPDQEASLRVTLERLHFELPPSLGQSAQPLEDAPRIRIGTYDDARNFRTIPIQPLEDADSDDETPMKLRVTLGDDVHISRGTELRAKLEGELVLHVANQTHASGRLFVASGRVDALGKEFEISEALLAYQNDDPSNPRVTATAVWESPDGYRVFAEFRGPAQSGELSFRSEPPLSESEIFSLLVVGNPDGMVGATASNTDDSGGAGAAAGAVGGVATAGLNRALDDLTELEVTTRIDTSDSASPRPEVGVRLSPRLSMAIGYTLGQSSLDAEPDRALVRLDYSLWNRWSLSTTLGDRGTSRAALIWQYRY